MDTIQRSFADGEHTLGGFGGLLMNPAAALRWASQQTQRRRSDFDLEILSASVYPNSPVSAIQADRNSNPTHKRQLFGGIVVDDTAEVPLEIARGNRSEEKSGPKKRSRRSGKIDDDEGNKKQRGRPRLDARDETAADRRRTQIRLAQRAYRHRKEATISALQKKVTQLEGTIESMNKIFVQFQDNAVDSGLLTFSPDLVHQLKNATEQFVSLAKTASTESERQEANVTGMAHPESRSMSPPYPSVQTTELQQATELQDMELDDDQVYEASFPPITGNEDYLEDPPTFELPEVSWNQTSTNLVAGSMSKLCPNTSDVQLRNDRISDLLRGIELQAPPLEKPWKASTPYTYSFQETTFARRLQRLSLEHGFRLLADPNPEPEEIAHTFRFTFCFSNKKRMRARFQELLKRKAGESLENWNVPFFRIGGAGTHFPRYDDQGTAIYPPNTFHVDKAIGPRPFVAAETPRGKIDCSNS